MRVSAFVGTIVHASIPGVIFLITVFIAWRYQHIGTVILLIEGIAIAIAYPLLFGSRFPVSTVLYVEATLALPPFLAGILLLFDCGKRTASSRAWIVPPEFAVGREPCAPGVGLVKSSPV